MKRKRRWIQEYRCSQYQMNILKKVFFCKQPYDDKCRSCPNRGNEDGLNSVETESLREST
jgi:hypothetical protein